jgi:hypothetical protein
MFGDIPFHTEEQYLVPLVIILLVEYILVITILFALQKNKIIYKGFSEGKNFNNFLSSHGGYGGGLLLCVFRFLLLVMFSCVVGYNYGYNPHKLGLKHADWALYNQWSLLLVTFYFLVVTVLSIRKLHFNSNYSKELSLIDPKLTRFSSLLFSVTGTVVLVSSALSIYEHKLDVVYIDHIVLASMMMEIFFNNFSVTASDLFLSFTFSFLYISFLFICVMLFDTIDWPHSLFRLKDRWCLLRYNIFIFTHTLMFGVFYLLVNKLACGSARVLPKIIPVTVTDTEDKSTREGQNPDDQKVLEGDVIPETDHETDENGNDIDPDVENQQPKRSLRHVKTMDEELEEQYCPNNQDSFKGPPPPGAGDLTEEEERELKHDVGKLSYQLTKQAEKYEKLKHHSEEKDIKLKQLEADLEAKNSRLQMLVAQQKEILQKRIETPVEEFSVPRHHAKTKTESSDSAGGLLKICGVVNCPGCEKEYQVNEDMQLVEIDDDVVETKKKNNHHGITPVLEPFITEDIDKDYFRHVLLAELTKDCRKRAKKLGIPIYYNTDIDKGKEKTFKLKKDLQNEIYLVCTGDLLYPSRDPETIKHEKKAHLMESKEKVKGQEDGLDVLESPYDNNGRMSSVVSPESSKSLPPPRSFSSPHNKNNTSSAADEKKKQTKKIVFYRQKAALKETLAKESTDEIRERADDLNIDIYDDEGRLKLKKDLKAEVYGEMTGDNIYDDIHCMSRMYSQVLN